LRTKVDVQQFTIWKTRSNIEANCRGYCRYEIDWGRRFAVGVEFGSGPEQGGSISVPPVVRVRYLLPPGLRWGDSPPVPRTPYRSVWPPWGWSLAPDSQNCEFVDARVALCETAAADGVNGVFGWLFDVIAERGGSYRLRAEIVDPPASGDATPGNNAGWIDVIVTKGGTSGPVKVSAVKLSRPRPSYVVAEVAVTTPAGLPVAPKLLSCTATFVGDSTYRGRPLPSARPGVAKCTVIFNNQRYRGKTLRGTLAFTANGKRVTRVYSVKV
jgi:hypothetical protein